MLSQLSVSSLAHLRVIASVLKGLCHNDSAILGNSMLISFPCAFTHTQNAPLKLSGTCQMSFFGES